MLIVGTVVLHLIILLTSSGRFRSDTKVSLCSPTVVNDFSGCNEITSSKLKVKNNDDNSVMVLMYNKDNSKTLVFVRNGNNGQKMNLKPSKSGNEQHFDFPLNATYVCRKILMKKSRKLRNHLSCNTSKDDTIKQKLKLKQHRKISNIIFKLSTERYLKLKSHRSIQPMKNRIQHKVLLKQFKATVHKRQNMGENNTRSILKQLLKRHRSHRPADHRFNILLHQTHYRKRFLRQFSRRYVFEPSAKKSCNQMRTASKHRPFANCSSKIHIRKSTSSRIKSNLSAESRLFMVKDRKILLKIHKGNVSSATSSRLIETAARYTNKINVVRRRKYNNQHTTCKKCRKLILKARKHGVSPTRRKRKLKVKARPTVTTQQFSSTNPLTYDIYSIAIFTIAVAFAALLRQIHRFPLIAGETGDPIVHSPHDSSKKKQSPMQPRQQDETMAALSHVQSLDSHFFSEEEHRNISSPEAASFGTPPNSIQSHCRHHGVSASTASRMVTRAMAAAMAAAERTAEAHQQHRSPVRMLFSME